MFGRRSIVILMILFTLVMSSSVLADDGRINRTPYHFGGDTLFCTEETGCTLLDKTGHELAHFAMSDIATAFALSDSTGQNVQVSGEGNGTYGPMQLWSVSPDATTGNNVLCMLGFDEWGKQNDMCFQVTKDFHFQQAPLAVTAQPTAEPTVIITEPAPTPSPTASPTPEPTLPPKPSPTPSATPNPCYTSFSISSPLSVCIG